MSEQLFGGRNYLEWGLTRASYRTIQLLAAQLSPGRLALNRNQAVVLALGRRVEGDVWHHESIAWQGNVPQWSADEVGRVVGHGIVDRRRPCCVHGHTVEEIARR